VKTDGTQGAQLTDDSGYSRFVVLDKWIYAVYSAIEYPYGVRKDTDTPAAPKEGYYQLVRMDLDGRNESVLAELPWGIFDLMVVDGSIYFLSSSSGTERIIYRVNPDGSGVLAVVQFPSGIAPSDLNIVGEWVYYTSDEGISRMSLNQQGKEVLMKDEEMKIKPYYMIVAGDTIYYSDGNSVCSMLTDGTCDTLLWEMKDVYITSMNYAGGWVLYYGRSDTGTFEIGGVKADGSRQGRILDGLSEGINYTCPNIVIIDNWVFFFAAVRSDSGTYFLHRVRTDGADCQLIDYHPTTWNT